jgi:hypothetical protein
MEAGLALLEQQLTNLLIGGKFKHPSLVASIGECNVVPSQSQ